MKATFLKIIFFSLFLIAFNMLFFFLSGTDNPPTVWVAYGFIHWAYLMVLITPLLGTKGKDSFYLNATLYSQSISYFVIEFVVGLVFVFWRPESILWSVLSQSFLWLVYMAIIIGNAWSNEVTDKQTAERAKAHESITVNRMELKKLIMQIDDMAIRRKVSDIYDMLTASNTRQTVDSIGYDMEINNNISLLRQAVYSHDTESISNIVEKLKVLALQRKAELKYAH